VSFCPECEAEALRTAGEERRREKADKDEALKRMTARDQARAVKTWCKCLHKWQQGERFCPDCGRQNPNPSFCTKCGKAVGTCSHTR